MQDRSPNVQYGLTHCIARHMACPHPSYSVARKEAQLFCPALLQPLISRGILKHNIVLFCRRRQFEVIVFRPNNTALSEPRPLQRADSVQSLYLGRSQSECSGDMYVLLSVSGAVYAYIL